MESSDVTQLIGELLSFLKLATIFAFILVVIWLNKHYKVRKAEAGSLAVEEKQALEGLARTAERMDQRLGTLEKILDAEDPKWRDRAA
jgi:phage shock protein B